MTELPTHFPMISLMGPNKEGLDGRVRNDNGPQECAGV
jgi:hypothetical protein